MTVQQMRDRVWQRLHSAGQMTANVGPLALALLLEDQILRAMDMALAAILYLGIWGACLYWLPLWVANRGTRWLLDD